MRTIDPIFSAAAGNGTGVPFAYLQDGSDNIYPIHKFRMEGFTLKAFAYDFPLTAGPTAEYKLKRGLTIQGVNYEITSPIFYVTKIVAPMAGSAEIEISMSVFIDRYTYFTSIDASGTAEEVIGAALSAFAPSYLPAFVTGETWKDHQFDNSGATLNLNSFNGLIPMLFNKYGARIFVRDVDETDSTIFMCLSRHACEHLTGDEYAWLTPSTDKRTSVSISDRTTQWNVFWTDQNNSTHKLSATYSEALSKPVRNVGFFHTDVTAADLKAMHYDITGNNAFLRHDQFTLPFTPEVENGDFLKYSNSQFLFAEIQESFNMPGTIYPWQTKITGAQMYYSLGAE